MSGGGGGSSSVPPPPLGTQYSFQNQPGADQGAYSGTQSIQNSSFYGPPGQQSFLFPNGVYNSNGAQLIAGTPGPAQSGAQGGMAVGPNIDPMGAQSGGSMAQGGSAGNSFLTPTEAQQILAGNYGQLTSAQQTQLQQMAGLGGSTSSGAQPNATMDQTLATDIYKDAGGLNAPLSPADQAQLTAIAYGGGQGGQGGQSGQSGSSLGGYQGSAPGYNTLAGQAGGGGGTASGGGGNNQAYPGAAAYMGLGPEIAAMAQGIGPYEQSLAQNVLSGQGNAAGVGQSLENQSVNPQFQQLYNAGGSLINQSTNPSLQGFEQQALTNAFDPQQALYNRTLQQVQDQTRAGLEARGLDMSPYGAGVEGQNLSNFNIDWQAQQLANQAQGAQTAGTLGGLQSNLAGAGANLIGTGANAQAGLAKAGEGVLAQNTLATGTASDLVNQGLTSQIQGLQGLQQGAISAYAQPQQAIQDYLQYLQAATGQNQVNAGIYGSQLSAANQQQANSNNMSLGMLGAASSLIGK